MLTPIASPVLPDWCPIARSARAPQSRRTTGASRSRRGRSKKETILHAALYLDFDAILTGCRDTSQPAVIGGAPAVGDRWLGGSGDARVSLARDHV
jgi:hypothetical protein